MYEVWVKEGIGMHADKMLCAFVSATLRSAVQVQNLYLKRGICARIQHMPTTSSAPKTK